MQADIVGPREKACCFSGHRPDKLPGGYRRDPTACHSLREALREAIGRTVAEGIDTFLCGMALGVDLWAAEEVLRLKQEKSGLRLVAALPCPQQADRWNAADKRRHRELLAMADEIYTACPAYTPYCMNARNRWMVDHACRLIAVFDGSPGGTANTLHMAAKQGLSIIRIDPWDFLP